MAITIISVKEQKGEYQGKTYHNYVVYGINPDSKNSQVVCGSDVEQMKVKAEVFLAALNRNIGALGNPNVKDVRDMLGLHIVPVYNKWGNVDDFVLAIPEKPSK